VVESDDTLLTCRSVERCASGGLARKAISVGVAPVVYTTLRSLSVQRRSSYAIRAQAPCRSTYAEKQMRLPTFTLFLDAKYPWKLYNDDPHR